MEKLRLRVFVPAILAMSLAACGGSNRSPQSAENAPASPPPTATSGAATSSDVGSIAPETSTTSSTLPTPAPMTPSPSTTPAPAEAQAPNTPAPLTDAEILQVTHTANEGEIAQAKLAEQKSKDPRVKKLAAMMLKDHTAADAKGMTIAKKDDLTPAPSTDSSSLERDAQSATMMLRAENGTAFDKDYVDTQVKEHQAVLDAIDQKLLPNAQDANVKAFLIDVRATVAKHLRHAQELQSKLMK